MCRTCRLLLPLVLLNAPLAAQHPSAGHSNRCGESALPVHLPSVAELLDSATAVAVLPSDTSFARGTVLMSLAIDSAGRLRQVRVLNTDLPEPTAERLAAILAGLVERQPSGASAWRVRLTAELGAGPRLLVARSELCRAQFKSEGELTTELVRIELDARPVDVPAHWVVKVDAAGRVQDAQILRRTAYPELEQEAAKGLHQARFLPASLDGEPLATTDTVLYHVSGFVRGFGNR